MSCAVIIYLGLILVLFHGDVRVILLIFLFSRLLLFTTVLTSNDSPCWWKLLHNVEEYLDVIGTLGRQREDP